MKSLRNSCTGPRPVHAFRKLGGVAAAALIAVGAPLASAHATPIATAATATALPLSGQSVAAFYKARKDAPLWLAPSAGNAAERLVGLLSTASLDGLNPDRYQVAALESALEAARKGKHKDVEHADEMLSAAFAAYVADMRQDPGVGITYVDPSLRPTPPTPLAALLMASAAPSLADYLRDMAWMNPIYGQLRQALVTHQYSDEHERQLIALNLQRSRSLPPGSQRYILVNVAQQRLYMYDNGKVVDSMVVVVGKPKYPTPMLAAYVRYAALNPYWYVPPDLAGEDVAQFVVKQGLKYLDDMGYQVVADWTPNPKIIDPKTVNWQDVLDGKVEVMIRQQPGPHNFMGRMKFMFPNDFGVYLHDNPRRELFTKAARFFSGGCVRLEDAPRLGRWLFGRDLVWEGAGTEEPVPLAQPVPVYITYLTAMPTGSSIAYFDDVYGRDAARVATADANGSTAAGGSR